MEITKEMKTHFEKRLKRHKDSFEFFHFHYSCVSDFLEPLDLTYKEPLSYGEETPSNHDSSKLIEPEYTPYILITWEYYCKRKGIPFEVDFITRDSMIEATEHHIRNNRHHPEFWVTQTDQDFINKLNRDKPVKLLNASKMPKKHIVEMCADWCSVSLERGNTPMEWAEKNIGVRWKFGKEKEDFIYKVLDKMW